MISFERLCQQWLSDRFGTNPDKIERYEYITKIYNDLLATIEKEKKEKKANLIRVRSQSSDSPKTESDIDEEFESALIKKDTEHVF